MTELLDFDFAGERRKIEKSWDEKRKENLRVIAGIDIEELFNKMPDGLESIDLRSSRYHSTTQNYITDGKEYSKPENWLKLADIIVHWNRPMVALNRIHEQFGLPAPFYV